MKKLRLSYTVATPEVERSPLAWVGDPALVLPLVAEIGYTGVELQMQDPRRFDVNKYRTTLNSAGLTPIGISIGPAAAGEGLYYTSPDEAVRAEARARMRLAIECAADWDSTVAVGGVRGRIGWAHNDSLGHAWLREGVDDSLEYAERHGVTLILEPQSKAGTDTFNTVGSALEFVKSYQSEFFGIEADTYHIAIEERSIVGALAEAQASGKLIHVQLGDSNRLAPGWGHINWVDVLSVLFGGGYRGWFGVEINQLPDGESAARQSYAFLRLLGESTQLG